MIRYAIVLCLLAVNAAQAMPDPSNKFWGPDKQTPDLPDPAPQPAPAQAPQPAPAQAPAPRAKRVPRYADYPAAVYAGPSASVQLDTDFKRSMRTQLRNGAKAPPNFAGSHHVVTWGCGTNCLNGFVVDRRSGKVYELPEEPEDFQLFDLWHRANSRLFVATNRGYNQNDCIRTPRWFFYVLERGKFRLIKAVEWPNKRWAFPGLDYTPEQVESALVDESANAEACPAETKGPPGPETVPAKP